MENTDNGKKLGIILFTVIITILTIILIIFASSSMNINKRNEGVKITSTTSVTTTKAPDLGFNEIPEEEKDTYNEWLNEDLVISALENATNGSYSTNMIESEASKFRFIYTYVNYNNRNKVMTIDEINEYSRLLFDTTLSERSLTDYQTTDGFKYQIIDVSTLHCYRVTSQMNQILLVNKVLDNEDGCNFENNDYSENSIINTIRIGYDLINDNYVFKTFIIIR